MCKHANAWNESELTFWKIFLESVGVTRDTCLIPDLAETLVFKFGKKSIAFKFPIYSGEINSVTERRFKGCLQKKIMLFSITKQLLKYSLTS